MTYLKLFIVKLVAIPLLSFIITLVWYAVDMFLNWRKKDDE